MQETAAGLKDLDLLEAAGVKGWTPPSIQAQSDRKRIKSKKKKKKNLKESLSFYIIVYKGPEDGEESGAGSGVAVFAKPGFHTLRFSHEQRRLHVSHL